MKVIQSLKDTPHKLSVCYGPWPTSVPVACQAPGAVLGKSPPDHFRMVKWLWLTFRVKEWDDAQLALGHIKCMFQVMPGIGILQLVKVDEVRPRDKS